MYRSPIDVLISDIQHQIAEQQDNEVYKAVVSVGINVDRDELIRALAYDRHQYMKGYADGKKAAMDELVRCKDCKHYREGFCFHENWWQDDGFTDVCENDFCSYGERRDKE